jgi:hypothetical protein
MLAWIWLCRRDVVIGMISCHEKRIQVDTMPEMGLSFEEFL